MPITSTTVCQDFHDILGDRVWSDPHAAHDPRLLQWLVALGFKKIYTAFSTATPGTALAESSAWAPSQRADFQVAREEFMSYFSGNKTIRTYWDARECPVLLAPEKNEAQDLFVAKVQRDCLEVFLAIEQGNTDYKERQFGILSHLPRVPLDQDYTPDESLALHFYDIPLLHIGLWAFIDQIQVTVAPYKIQTSTGYKNPKPTQLEHHGVLMIISGENTKALQLVKDAHAQTWLSTESYVGQINWGCMRQSLDHLEYKMSKTERHSRGG